MNRPCIASVDFRRDEAYVDKINVEAIVQAETNVAGHPNVGKVRRPKSFVMSEVDSSPRNLLVSGVTAGRPERCRV